MKLQKGGVKKFQTPKRGVKKVSTPKEGGQKSLNMRRFSKIFRGYARTPIEVALFSYIHSSAEL